MVLPSTTERGKMGLCESESESHDDVIELLKAKFNSTRFHCFDCVLFDVLFDWPAGLRSNWVYC